MRFLSLAVLASFLLAASAVPAFAIEDVVCDEDPGDYVAVRVAPGARLPAKMEVRRDDTEKKEKKAEARRPRLLARARK